MNYIIRKAAPMDYSSACDIGTKCYPDRYYEGEESFRSKMTNSPDGCFVVELDCEILGYVISFPYLDGLPFPINQNYELPNYPDCTYIHDVCVLPEFRKKGLASLLVNRILYTKGNFRLTAVENSESFWASKGFSVVKEIIYCGKKASYMAKMVCLGFLLLLCSCSLKSGQLPTAEAVGLSFQL